MLIEEDGVLRSFLQPNTQLQPKQIATNKPTNRTKHSDWCQKGEQLEEATTSGPNLEEMRNAHITIPKKTTSVMHLSMRSVRNTMGTRGTPE